MRRCGVRVPRVLLRGVGRPEFSAAPIWARMRAAGNALALFILLGGAAGAVRRPRLRGIIFHPAHGGALRRAVSGEAFAFIANELTAPFTKGAIEHHFCNLAHLYPHHSCGFNYLPA